MQIGRKAAPASTRRDEVSALRHMRTLRAARSLMRRTQRAGGYRDEPQVDTATLGCGPAAPVTDPPSQSLTNASHK